MFTFLALCCLLYLFLTMSFCLHSYCIHQILDSVSYAHQHDIVHRDLKVCVSLCLCARAYFIFLHLFLRATVTLHMLVLIAILFVPASQTCLCLLSVCLFVSFFLPRLSAHLQALHLGLFLHYFGWSKGKTRVLADTTLGCL